jgi:Flp pilus assembly protein TadD
MGLAARSVKNLEEARRWFARAIEEKPSYAPAQQELGIVLVELQRYSEAIGPLRRADALSPENAIVSNYLGVVYSNTARLKEAVESYQKALRFKNDYPAARLNLAFAFLKLGDRATARREFETLCRESPALCQQYRNRFE